MGFKKMFWTILFKNFLFQTKSLLIAKYLFDQLLPIFFFSNDSRLKNPAAFN